MQLVKEGTVIDFLGKRFYAAIFSAILLVGGVVSILMHQGLNYGIDFRGGTNIQIRFKEVPNLDELRKFFSKQDLEITSWFIHFRTNSSPITQTIQKKIFI